MRSFVLREGVYATLWPDTQRDRPRSVVNPAASVKGDLATMLAIQQQRLASPENSGSVARLHEG
jgi:hypothetical protein